MARIRRNVWDIVGDPTDKTLEWYGKAVAAMKLRPIADHRSWRYQAAIHEYDRANDPLAAAADQLPPLPVQSRYWTKCQHSSWFFLPWHRMYLHHFEKIVAAEVAVLGGPANWALPYWNYSKGAASRKLPTPFRAAVLAGGGPNPLHAPRHPQANAGNDFADALDADIKVCLKAPTFTAPIAAGTAGFGGPSTGFHHGGGPIGLLEKTPHGDIHVAVSGWMGGFNTAGLDPVFWLHHANIDRLWEVWLRRKPAHTNPSAPLWRSGVTFEFRDAANNTVAMKSVDVLSTVVMPLDYEYDDVSDPFPLEPMGAADVAPTQPPEMVGATEHPFRLGDLPVTANVPIPLAGGQALQAMGADAGPQHAYLHLENITADDRAAAYDVYLGVPDGTDPRTQPEKRVGRIALFGVKEATRKDGPQAGSGLTYALEITDAVTLLKDQAGWNPQNLPVSFVPVRGASGVPVQVGRVSLYIA